ncbi:PorV/PorQ family protein [Fodinibius saliphilus]|uniref:PorV/PorQ family protein n=1 Tax=Fodinibius saliphilus TaxID=1920650 RepID=UPI0011082242|nr:PorV/PorQ family protein [Fodinibius saliphilus]
MQKPTAYCRSLLLFLIVTTCTTAVQAQHGGRAGAFSRLGFGPRGMAMGNAFTATTQEGIYSYYNPAVVAHAGTGNQIDLSTAAMSFDRSLHTISSTFRLPPSAGASISIINANVNDIDGRNADGYHTNMLSTHEYQLTATAGLSLRNNLSVGLGVKYYLSDLHNAVDNATTVGLDIGLLYKISNQLQLGATVQDLIAAYSWNSSNFYGDNLSSQNDPFPTQIKLGIFYNPMDKFHISLDGGQQIHEEGTITNINLGMAYGLHERVTLRAGWQIDAISAIKKTNHASAGFSIHLPFDFMNPSIDYAFVQESNKIAYMHIFGIQLNL